MDIIFDYLKEIFNTNKHRLYMIGGTSRDYLLGRTISDYDFVTDALPEEIVSFLDVDTTFLKYGTVKYHYLGNKIDITTLRKEGPYLDKRHPSFVKFIKDINVDYLRRDFTINAIYIDENYKLIDPSNGYDDLINKKVLRFIGVAQNKIEEDPLRILRGERFALEYNLTISSKLKKLFKENYSLLNSLNRDKINEENNKMMKVKEQKICESTKL